MLPPDNLPYRHTVLTEYNLPTLTFTSASAVHTAVRPLWDAMARGDVQETLRLGDALVMHGPSTALPAEAQAQVQLAVAAARWRTGSNAAARQHARQALVLHPAQWAAHRLLLELDAAQHDFAAASDRLASLEDRLGATPAWDEPLSPTVRAVALAAWSWRQRRWDRVATHLAAAYPDGPATMPANLLEDCFLLAHYRNRPADAALAVEHLLPTRSLEALDELLQTMVQRKWTAEALTLYRGVFARWPKSELVRRRLVGLCIKEGELDEARRLAKPGALSLAA